MATTNALILTGKKREDLRKKVQALLDAEGDGWVLVNRDEAPRPPDEDERTADALMAAFKVAVEVIDSSTKAAAEVILDTAKATVGVLEG